MTEHDYWTVISYEPYVKLIGDLIGIDILQLLSDELLSDEMKQLDYNDWVCFQVGVFTYVVYYFTKNRNMDNVIAKEIHDRGYNRHEADYFTRGAQWAFKLVRQAEQEIEEQKKAERKSPKSVARSAFPGRDVTDAIFDMDKPDRRAY